tara:strand:- start:1294 stop:1857 length:564 start_codon:yes stop_codon:yes gene_type:complete
MTDNDKILINAFLDNELSTDDTKYVENLFKEDRDAAEYLNLVKKANIEINQFFNEIDLSKNFKQEKYSLAKSFMDLLKNSFIGYATTAVIFFGIGTQFIDDGFMESNLEFNYLTLRSDNEDAQLILILNEMLDKKINTAKIDSDFYKLISITPQKNSECIFFELNGEVNSVGKYCKQNNYLHISNID